MPASLKRLRDTKGLVFLHVCEECGVDAPFGVGVNMLASVRALAGGDATTAKRRLGLWYCGKHRPGGAA